MKVSRRRCPAHRIRGKAFRVHRALTRRCGLLRDWALARRRTALGQLLRGICFGCGSGLITLATLWLTRS
ncbi:hypothetical protein [Streptomyces mesophilus]|uniref:hypothetical protein n=1 Tax=Streptomyces mesophilus TaxID=1775132 RepID=UPI00331C0F54